MQNYEKLTFHPEKRAREDFVTWAAEAIHGQMRTPTEYQFNSQQNELVAEDGSEVGTIFENALTSADELVKTNPQLKFEQRRRGHEMDEYQDMLAIMRGELPNTMVVVSDFPPELMNYPKDVGGYNVERKPTFLRVIFKDGNRLKMFSQTLDTSDRDGLEAIYHTLGFSPQPGELLGQRMPLDTDKDDQRLLVDQLVRAYDHTLEQKYGGLFEAGIQMPDRKAGINSYSFVHEQADIVRFAVKEVLGNSFDESKQYELMAVLAKRYEQTRHGALTYGELNHEHQALTHGQLALDQSLLLQEMAVYGREARLAGTIFSGCGATLESTQIMSIESQLAVDGYGDQTSKEETYNFDAYQFCVSCQAPPKEKAKKKMCGPCGLCRSCDKKAGGKG